MKVAVLHGKQILDCSLLFLGVFASREEALAAIALIRSEETCLKGVIFKAEETFRISECEIGEFHSEIKQIMKSDDRIVEKLIRIMEETLKKRTTIQDRIANVRKRLKGYLR